MSTPAVPTCSLTPALVALLLLASACKQADRHQRPALQAPVNAAKPVEYPGLHNVVDYAPGIYSGAVPEGDAGFASLSALGIRTVLSVDGTLPEVDKAEAHGLRYVHLPIGYDSVPADRGKQIAAVVSKLDKPVYIHCHHGKHRSAGAAATACVITGLLTPEAAIARMQVSGTAPDYEGLYASVRSATPLPDSALPADPGSFTSSSKVSGTVASMVAIDAAMDELKIAKAEQWQVPKGHPDLVPANSGKRLHDLMANHAGDAEARQQPAAYHRFLQQAIAAADGLRQALAGSDAAAADAQFGALSASCKQCHKQFRDR